MDRETRRLVEEFRRNAASPIENNLIDELVAGELDRQEFLRRAAVFGLGAGTIGTALQVSRRARAGVRRTRSRRRRWAARCASASVAYNWRLEPYELQEAGSLGLAGIPGEYLHLRTNNNAPAEAVARNELEAEQGR